MEVIELRRAEDGIVVVNELPIEGSICAALLPSEMPASYELEALKAQAVCAKTMLTDRWKAMDTQV